MAPSPSELVEIALKKRLVGKQKVVAASEKDTTAFSIRSKNHNMSITTNHVFLWKTKHAIRELVTNAIDGAVEMANEIGQAGKVVWKVHVDDVGDVSDVSTCLGSIPIPMATEWRATASLYDIEVAEIHFARSTAGKLLYVFITNHFTCLHVLKIFGFGFSTKVNDATQSGKFGDGLKSATVTLVRPWNDRRSGDRKTKARMALQTNGRLWSFSFDTREKPAWLRATKEATNWKGDRFTAIEKRDTVITLKWPDPEVHLSAIFDEKMYMEFIPRAELDTLQLGGGAALINGDAFENTIYVTGVRVCESESFVAGVGYMDDVMLRKHMTRDRSVISTDAIWKSFVTRVRAFLDNGGAVDRIYELTAAVRDGDWNAFHRLATVGGQVGGTWSDSFAAHFMKLHGADAFPYNEVAHRELIEADLGKTAVRVNRCLYDILCQSKAFAPISEAVAREFIFGSEDRDWRRPSSVYRCAAIVVQNVLDRAGEVAAHRLLLRDTTCQRRVIAKRSPEDDIMDVYIKSSAVEEIDESGSRRRMRILMHDVMHALQDLDKTYLEREDIAYLYTLIGDISCGRFDEKYGESEVEEGSTEEEEEEGSAEEDSAEEEEGPADEEEEEGSAEEEEEEGPAEEEEEEEEEGPTEPGSRKRPVPISDDEEEPPRPYKRGRLEAPKPESVRKGVTYRAGAQLPPLPPPKKQSEISGHWHRGNLEAMDTLAQGQYGAVYYKSSAWDHYPTRNEDDILNVIAAQRAYDTTANVVRILLRHVFDWDDSVTFGVYEEDSPTFAFTRGGTQLFVNAYHFDTNVKWIENLYTYFSVLCHETTHMLGHDRHDSNFAAAVAEVTAKYQSKLVSYLMALHVSDDCDSTCLVEGKHMCFEHRGAGAIKDV